MKLLSDVVKQIELQIGRYDWAVVLDRYAFSEPPTVRVDVVDEYMKVMVHAMQRVAEQQECVATYPSDWWQAVKQRFAPAWFLDRWPVLEIRIDMHVLYPKITLPERGHVVRLAKIGPLQFPKDLE